MAAPTAGNILLPSLYDRLLADDGALAPGTMTSDDLCEQVKAHLERLFNSRARNDLDLERHPNSHVRNGLKGFARVNSSVLNYGLPSLCGTGVLKTDVRRMEEDIRAAIIAFEPRIDPGTLTVGLLESNDESSGGILQIRIECQVMARPVPVSMSLRTDIDLDAGRLRLTRSGDAS